MSAIAIEIVLVAADFNRQVVDVMIESASAEVRERGGRVVRVVRVPGSYELPLACKQVLSSVPCAAMVVLGYIERGETLHGQVMGSVVHHSLVSLSLAHDKPIGIGIIGPGATPEQADSRKDDYARAAVRAALAAVAVQRELASGS
jgi:6,7-dimethyl-8-ribityllumazine synthase